MTGGIAGDGASAKRQRRIAAEGSTAVPSCRIASDGAVSKDER